MMIRKANERGPRETGLARELPHFQLGGLSRSAMCIVEGTSVVVINETMAQPGQDPMGKTFSGAHPRARRRDEVVGVVADIRDYRYDQEVRPIFLGAERPQVLGSSLQPSAMLQFSSIMSGMMSGIMSVVWVYQISRLHQLDMSQKMVRIIVMEAPIAEVKRRLCELVDRVEAGETIIILRHGRPSARLTPMPGRGRPWRVAQPDDPAPYKEIDLDEPVLEEI